MLARYSKYVTLKFEYLKNPQTSINNIMKLVTENEVKFIKKINIFDKNVYIFDIKCNPALFLNKIRLFTCILQSL